MLERQERSLAIEDEDESNARFEVDLPDRSLVDVIDDRWRTVGQHHRPCITIRLYNLSRLRSDWLFAMHEISAYDDND